MTLSELSIRKPVFAWVLMFGLIFFGAISFTKMGINENPDVDYPKISISYSYQGATPEVVEKDIIEPVESYLVSIQGIRNISSSAQRGAATIDLEFELSRQIDFALQEVQTVLGRAQGQLPNNLEPPIVTKNNAADQPVLFASLYATDLSQRDLMILFRDRVRDRLSTVPGVAEIRAFGYHEPILRIELDPAKLQTYHLTSRDVIDSIQREHSELPAGRFEYKEDEKLIRIIGEARRVEEFQNMTISRRGGAPNFVPIRLKEVANIYEGIENIRRLSRINGKNALGMAIQKQSGENVVDVADQLIERIEEINQELKPQAGLIVNFDRTQFIRQSVDELVMTLALSAALTSLVCWVFLGSWSATSNILLAIPTSIIGTFIVINLLGFTLNNFSLLGLALAIGVVVDDAIIMLENISRYMQLGYNRMQAAFLGSKEITFAVIATSLALISIFIPITFMQGIEGRFFWEFAVTICVAVALSSLEALTLAPMRCSQFLVVSQRTTWFGRGFERSLDWLKDCYESTLKWTLKWRILVVIGSILTMVASYFAMQKLPTEFAPPQDQGVVFIIFLAPDGRSMAYTSAKVAAFEKIALNHPDVERTFVAIGGFGQGGQGNRGNGILVLKPYEQRKRGVSEITKELRELADQNIPGLKVILRDQVSSSIGGRRGSPLEFTINGPQPEMQKQLYFKMQQAMIDSGQMVGIQSNDVRELPEIRIEPDREKALARGVDILEISRVVNDTLGGVIVGQYTEGSRRFGIFVQLMAEHRQVTKDLEKIFVRNNRGELIPLIDVIQIVETKGPESIFREDRIRGIRVDGSLANNTTQGQAIKTVKTLASKILPDKYYVRFSDTPEDKIFELIIIMALGLIIAYMVLASQFNSFMDPFIVYLAVPFGIIGSILGLLAGGQSLNVYSVIGMLLTMGIVMKNSILLVEFTNHLRDEGLSLNEALLKACPIRLRPILMTTIATLAAAAPAAFSFGPGSETRIPMALTVLGGVGLSTLFTLFVVPCVFSLLHPKRRVVDLGIGTSARDRGDQNADHETNPKEVCER